MPPFAQPDDLTGWLTADQLTAVSGDVERLLRRASEVVAEAATTGWTTLADGAPALTWEAEALRDATCAQIEQWLEVGEENDIAGYRRDTAMSSNGLSLSSLPSTLAPRARRILRQAGLTRVGAW